MTKQCLYCGKNPVPHFLYWYNESLNILFTGVRQKILYNSFSEILVKHSVVYNFERAILKIALWLRIVRTQSNIEKCKIPRALVLWEELVKRGGDMQELLLFGKPIDVYIAKKSGKQLVFSGLPRPAGYFNKWLDIMDDKWVFKKELIKNNIPVPSGRAVTSLSQAKKIFNEIQKPVIVKPRSGSRGRHSTTFINTIEDLEKAFYIAKKLCYWVIVEEQITGPVYRATVVNFSLEGVLLGLPPKVTGNGIDTILKLIEEKNILKSSGVKNIVIDNGVLNFLGRQNLSMDSILEVGREVYLTEKIGVSYGGVSREDYNICHKDNKDLFVNVARLLQDPIVGFDFIIPDITKSYKEQKCGFIEVNSLPFINLHHDPLLGSPRNVAGKIWDLMGW